jgi:hypothetical protein
MRDSSKGTAGCGAASEDLAAPVALRGAMTFGWQRFAARRWKAQGIWMHKFFERGAAAAMCCERGEGAFSAKL